MSNELLRSPWTPFSHRMTRNDVDRDYVLWVDLPPTYDPDGEEPHPVYLCFDAMWTYGTVVDTVRLLAPSKELPKAIVIGVAHDEPSYREVIQLRAMDFTTTAVDAPALTGVRVPGEQLGGAEAFRRWLAAEVIPFLKTQYRISEMTFIGHSFSALFGVHVLLETSAMFDHYLLASPSVWWDDQVMFRREQQRYESSKHLDAHVFMSKGELETDELSPHQEFHDQMVSREYEGLNLHWKVFPNESHMSVTPLALSHGLRTLYSTQ
ncbi:MAG: alpha/beta hydrolase [Acidimicrobiales bacterium]|nr:alpha/beta hydrolase [Acidimicrobiales bacterium]